MTIIWSHTPIIATSFVSDKVILFATEHEVFTCSMNNNVIRSLCLVPPNKSVYKITRAHSFAECNCVNTKHKQCHGCGFICLFGNNLCIIFDTSTEENVEVLLSIPTTDFLCGVCVCPRNDEYFLTTVSFGGFFKIYTLSGPNFMTPRLLQDICLTNSSMLYCARFIDCICHFDPSLLCVGGTSNCVFVWSFKDNLNGTPLVLSNFGVQKGIIFAVDLFKPAFVASCFLASAAEDRSIIIWSSLFDELCGTSQSRFRDWNILYRLDAHVPNSDFVLFESRIWGVQMNAWGVFATGEGCSLVCCPWPKSGSTLSPIVLRSIHRGRNIWCLDTYISDDSNELQIVTGGNDGSLVLNKCNLLSLKGGFTALEDLIYSVKPDVHIPKSKRPASGARHIFPSDAKFHNFFLATSPNLLDSESVMISSNVREVFIGPRGIIFVVFESGDLALLRTDNEAIGELTPLRPCLSPTLAKRLAKDMEFVDRDGAHLRQERLFPGYCVCGVHRGMGYIALGGRWGCVGIYQLLEDGSLLCHDLANLPPFQRITLIRWINESTLVIAMFPDITTYIRLNDMDNSKGLIRSFVYLERGRPDSQPRDLSWTTCADSLILHQPLPRECLITGTRSGVLALYELLPDSTKGAIHPAWSLDHCHGREGVTAVKILHETIVLSAGRQNGRVRRWRIVIPDGDGNIRLQMLDQVFKPSNMSWIGSFDSLPSGEVLALGFLAKKFLVVEIVPSKGDYLISETGAPLFTVDCVGKHRAWDLAYVPKDNSFVFAAIQKNGLIYTRQRLQKTPTVHGFRRQCLAPPLHGRDINTCLLLLHSRSIDEDRLTVKCYTGSEEPFLGSLALDVTSDFSVSYHESPPLFHSGHISNIRCLALCHGMVEHPSSRQYLVSGGGRGMLTVWRLDGDDPPGLVGWARLDTGFRDAGPLIACPHEIKRRDVYATCDLRIMALLAFHSADGQSLNVIAGCSDGSVRLIRVSLPSESTGWSPRFSQMADLRPVPRRSCILSLCCIAQSTESRRVTLACSKTNGIVEAFEVNLEKAGGLHLHHHLFTLRVEGTNPITKTVTPCAANSIALLAEYIAVAADDGSLRLADLRGVWRAQATRHFAAAVKVVSLIKQKALLTLGADHRLLLWQLKTGPGLVVLSEVTLSGLGDPQNISLLPTDSTEKTYLAMVCGSGLQLCHFILDK